MPAPHASPPRRRTCSALLSCAFTLASLLAGPARADNANERRAEALFREGREALARGDTKTACARFADSAKLTRSPGPLLNLARCDEQRGDLVVALQRYREGLTLLPAGDERGAVARERVEALEKQVPTLAMSPAPDAPSGIVVTLDGMPIAPAELGKPRPLDPGEYEVVVVAPGRPEARTKVRLGAGDRREITIGPGRAEGPSMQRIAGYAALGVGGAGIVAGAITGGLTIAKKNTVDANCVGGCNDTAREAASAGKALSAASTATFVIGAAGVVGGLILVLADKPKPTAPALTVGAMPLPSGGGILVQGRFF
jgi:hypothetical protein